LEKFYKDIGATEHKDALDTYGACYENSLQVQCEAQGGKEYAHYDKDKAVCVFEELWYKEKCESIDGYYENKVCYYPATVEGTETTPAE
jgi:hypothetical protein